MRHVAFEIEAVAFAQMRGFAAFQRNFQIALSECREILRLRGRRNRRCLRRERCGKDAAPSRCLPQASSSMRTPWAGFEDFPFGGADVAGIGFGGVEERKNVDAIEAGDAAQGGNRRAHLRAFESAEESNGNSGGCGDFGERKRACCKRSLRRRWPTGLGLRLLPSFEKPLAEQMHDRRGIHAASAAEKLGALEQADVAREYRGGSGCRCAWARQARPLSQERRDGGRYAHEARYITDA